MADEKKINDEVMSDAELEGVAGGAGEPYGGIDTDPAANQFGIVVGNPNTDRAAAELAFAPRGLGREGAACQTIQIMSSLKISLVLGLNNHKTRRTVAIVKKSPSQTSEGFFVAKTKFFC